MKTKLFLGLVALLALAHVAYAQGTAFTYNGRLNNNGAPANGAYDLRFTIYDASAAGNVHHGCGLPRLGCGAWLYNYRILMSPTSPSKHAGPKLVHPGKESR